MTGPAPGPPAPKSPDGLRGRLSPGIAARRMVQRGQVVYVLYNPATGRYMRTPPRGWAFLSLLDGRRTLGDALALLPPPGPGEPDDQGLRQSIPALLAAGVIAVPGLARPRGRTPSPGLRVMRGAMVTRLKLGDLAPVLRVAGRLLSVPYTRAGAALVVAMLLLAGLLWAGRGDVLMAQMARMRDPSLGDLVVWYLMFVASKTLHECGHAVAASRMAAAEAHRIDRFPFGVTFMFLLPAPYVDVSGTWFVASRWRRALVGMAGIWMDLTVAALAATVAALLAEGTLRDRLCELVVIAGVSSLLFNANPLVRLDGYYVLTDILEMPNLQGRALAALGRFVAAPFGFGMPRRGDGFLAAYSLAALGYRLAIFVGIFWLAGGRHWTLAAGVAVVVGTFYLLLPAMTGLSHLVRAGRKRPLRTAFGGAAVAAALTGLLLVPLPSWTVAEGIVWNDSLLLVFPGADGRLVAAAPAGRSDAVVLQLDNPETHRLRQQLALEAASLVVEARRARAESPGRIDAMDERAAAVLQQDQTLAAQIAAWTVVAPPDRRWFPLRAEQLKGTWVRRDDGRPLGAMLGDGPVAIRLVLDQWQGPAVFEALAHAPASEIPVRRIGEAAPLLRAHAETVLPDARDELPSPALAAPNGGPFALRADEPGLRTTARVFELRLVPDDQAQAAALMHGERVEARIPLPPAPLAVQVWRQARHLFQQRLGA